MHAVAGYVRLTRKKRFATVEAARRTLAAPKGLAAPPARLRAAQQVTCRQIGGFDCWSVTPAGRTAERAVVYAHGGAYVREIAAQHWHLISRLAGAGVRVDVPIYGLAPQHTYRPAYALLDTVYRDLLTEVAADKITIAGDSAGGGLALGYAQTLPTAGLPQPGRLLLIAPWLDLTLSNPGVPVVETRDPWLASIGLVELGRAWAGDDDPADPRLSPINGRLTGLPPISAYIGTRDLFYPDALELRRKAIAERVPFTLTVCHDAVHVYPLTPTPEGRAGTAGILKDITT